MTIQSIYAPAEYTNDGTLVFAITFEYLLESLKVYALNPDSVYALVSPDDYDVATSGTGPIYDGGTITFTTLPDTGTYSKIQIARETDRDQQLDFGPYDAFPAEANEFGLDKLTMIQQEATYGGTTDPGGDTTGAIPLAGTDVGFPVTGNVQFSKGKGLTWELEGFATNSITNEANFHFIDIVSPERAIQLKTNSYNFAINESLGGVSTNAPITGTDITLSGTLDVTGAATAASLTTTGNITSTGGVVDAPTVSTTNLEAAIGTFTNKIVTPGLETRNDALTTFYRPTVSFDPIAMFYSDHYGVNTKAVQVTAQGFFSHGGKVGRFFFDGADPEEVKCQLRISRDTGDFGKSQLGGATSLELSAPVINLSEIVDTTDPTEVNIYGTLDVSGDISGENLTLTNGSLSLLSPATAAEQGISVTGGTGGTGGGWELFREADGDARFALLDNAGAKTYQPWKAFNVNTTDPYHGEGSLLLRYKNTERLATVGAGVDVYDDLRVFNDTLQESGTVQATIASDGSITGTSVNAGTGTVAGGDVFITSDAVGPTQPDGLVISASAENLAIGQYAFAGQWGVVSTSGLTVSAADALQLASTAGNIGITASTTASVTTTSGDISLTPGSGTVDVTGDLDVDTITLGGTSLTTAAKLNNTSDTTGPIQAQLDDKAPAASPSISNATLTGTTSVPAGSDASITSDGIPGPVFSKTLPDNLVMTSSTASKMGIGEYFATGVQGVVSDDSMYIEAVGAGSNLLMEAGLDASITALSGSVKLVSSSVKMPSLPSGATQGLAGASAGELWIDTATGHTLRVGV